MRTGWTKNMVLVWFAGGRRANGIRWLGSFHADQLLLLSVQMHRPSILTAIASFVPIDPEQEKYPRIDGRRSYSRTSGESQHHGRRLATRVRHVQLQAVVRRSEADHAENQHNDLERE